MKPLDIHQRYSPEANNTTFFLIQNFLLTLLTGPSEILRLYGKTGICRCFNPDVLNASSSFCTHFINRKQRKKSPEKMKYWRMWIKTESRNFTLMGSGSRIIFKLDPDPVSINKRSRSTIAKNTQLWYNTKVVQKENIYM